MAKGKKQRSVEIISIDSDDDYVEIEDQQKTGEESVAGEEYEVEAIVGMRYCKDPEKAHFLVKWYGWDDSFNTWEPRGHLENCSEMIEDHIMRIFLSVPEEESTNVISSTVPQRTRAAAQATTSTSSDTHTTASSPLQSKRRRSPSVRPSRAVTIPKQTPSKEKTTQNFSVTKPISKAGRPLSKPTTSAQDPIFLAPGVVLQKDMSPDDLARMPARLRRFELMLKNAAPKAPPVVVENNVDNQAAPSDFTCITKNVLGDGVPELDPGFLTSCDCGPGGCSVQRSTKCPCVLESIEHNYAYHTIPFAPGGRIHAYSGQVLYECNDQCGCGPECATKASHKGRTIKIKLVRYLRKGWGVILDQDDPVPPYTFVIQYMGEVVTAAEAERRTETYDREGASYLFDLDYNVDQTADYSVDARYFGNESHFFNHSCDPNMRIMNLLGRHTADLGRMDVSFWTTKWIRRGDELTFDYRGYRHEDDDEDDHKNTRGKGGRKNKKDRKEEADEKDKCYCGAEKCRGKVFY